MITPLLGTRLLFTTKDAAKFLLITERQLRRIREDGWLHPVACTVSKPHGFLWDPWQLSREYEAYETRHAA